MKRSNKSIRGFRLHVPCLAVLAVLGWSAVCVAQPRGNQAAPAAEPKPPKFPLEFRIVDPDNPDNAGKKADEVKLPPMIMSFPKGQTHDGKDATASINRLESFRGKSKLLPAMNDDPGLPVLLCGLRFLENRDAAGKLLGYEVELQGEFNAVKATPSNEAMQSFLAHKPTVFQLESKLQYGLISTHTTTSLEVLWNGEHLFILAVEGDFAFREGFFIYQSATIQKSPDNARKYLYYGEPGELPKLRIL